MTGGADGPDGDALAALLDWHIESGVDIALDDAPHDRYADAAAALAKGARTVETEAPPPARVVRAAPLALPDEAARAARALAAEARNLDDLASSLAHFEHAPFRDMARHFLYFAEARGARVLVFDVAPGAAEESSGEAFCGPQAKLLDNMLAAISLGRNSASLAYLAPWRPPGDRALTPQETAIFAPFARRLAQLARPEFLLLFGEASARALLETDESWAKLRGRTLDLRFDEFETRAFVFSSLDAMLKGPALKPAAWRSLRALAHALG